MRALGMTTVALVSCSGPARHQQIASPRNAESAPEIELTEHRIGALTDDSIASVESLTQRLPGFTIRERKVEELFTVFDVYDRGELLYYVVENYDHTISAVHISSKRVVDRVTGWRVGGVVTEARNPRTNIEISGCKCGVIPSEHAFATANHWVEFSVGDCQPRTDVPPPPDPADPPDLSYEWGPSCPTTGTIERMVWYAPSSRD